MKATSLFTIPVCLIATVFVMADGAGSAGESANQQQSNLQLIRELVEGAIRLAGDEDPLSRADYCSTIAGRTVKEIQTAVRERHIDRAVQLSDHLHSMLSLGVANNLRMVRLESSLSSTREIDVQRVAAQVRDAVEPLDDLATERPENAAELAQALRKVREVRTDVERILKSGATP